MKLTLFLCIILLFSCENKDRSKESSLEKELKLREREILIKEKEVQLKDQELQKYKDENSNSNLPQAYKKVKSSVYLIYTQRTNTISQGSAFVINPYGVAVSNFHLFDEASEAIAINENGEKFQISEILSYDKDKDYIIFKLNTTKELPYAEISQKLPDIGEECFAVGNPEGLIQTLSKGIISSYRDNNRFIQTTTEITHGSSGGPLFNNHGEVIGITTGGRDVANLNFAVSISTVPYASYTNISRVRNDNQIKDEKIKNLILHYYYYADNGMFTEMSEMYAPILKRYFNQFNLEKSDALKNAQSYNQKFGVTNTHSDVNLNSLKINRLENGNYSVSYIMNYTLNRIHKEKPSHFILNIIIEINTNYKIESIYENILAKNR